MVFKTRLMCFLKMILTFSLCFSLVFAVAFEKNSTKRSLDEKYDVLILGAGMAGISAAKTLFDTGKTNFRVLEATNRIGGRLLLKEFCQAAVELGGNWVHGTDKNPIWTLVQQAGLNHVDTMIEPTQGNYIVKDENGKDVIWTDFHIELDRVNNCLDERIKEERAKKEPQDFSVRVGLTKCGWPDPKHPAAAQTAIEYYVHDFDAAVPPEEISCGVNLRSGEIDSTEGRQVLISDRRGYASIIENMAEKFKDKVLKNHLVEKISWGEKEVTVEVADVVEMKQKRFKANFVLVTFSIGVLQKQLESMFSPPLPSAFRGALGKMEMGNYLKIFMRFSERFWPPQYDYIFYASKDRGFYPVWQNLPGSKTGIPENDKILLVTVTGRKARELGEDKKRIAAELLPVLEKVFKPKPKLPDLLDIELKNWELDPLFRGAYSNPVVGTTTADFNTLLTPVGQNLFFAGEGLSEFYYGFLQGAYLTGEQQAREIDKKLKGLAMQKIGLNYVQRNSIGKQENETKY